jgi:hypothetical protein
MCNRRRRRSRALLGLAVGSILLSSSALPAQTVATWLTANSGDWNDPTRWSSNPFFPNNNNPPGASYIAQISATTGSPYTVFLQPSNVTVDAVNISAAGAQLALLQGGTLTTAAISLVNGSTLALQGGTLRNASLSGAGSLSASGGILDHITLGVPMSGVASSKTG